MSYLTLDPLVQVSPFRNPVALQETDGNAEISEVRVPQYNNAWLRAVAYKMLFGFQTVGLASFTVASFGIGPVTVTLLAGSTLVALIGPTKPFLVIERVIDGLKRPVLPLPWSLFLVFMLNAIVNSAAYWHLLFPPLQTALGARLEGAPHLVVVLLASLLAVLPPLTVGAGGAIEGGIAEATFNQWHHFIAFFILTTGLVFHLVAYSFLAHSVPV